MARKIPVVSTNSGGLKEVIGKNGVSGFCHNINEIDEYSSSIIKLLNSQNLREKISQNAYNRVTSLFSQKKMINDYFDSL